MIKAPHSKWSLHIIATWVRNKGPILAELSNYPWGPNHLALPQKQQTLITRRKLIRPRLLEQILVCAHSRQTRFFHALVKQQDGRRATWRRGRRFVHETLVNAVRGAAPRHLPPLVYRIPIFLRIRFAASPSLSSSFPAAARGHSPGTRPPPQGLPSHALVSPPARFLATLHSIARTGSRPSVHPSFRSPSVSREASFSAPTKAQREDRGKRRDISAFL